MTYRSSARELPPAGLVVVGQYLDTVSASLARARLETEGIRAFVTEAMSTNPLWNVAAGGTTLSVAAGSEEAARAVLEQMRREAAADEPDDGEADVRCPRCEGEYCFEERGLEGRMFRCRKCEHVFYDADDGPRRRTALPEGVSPPVFRLRRSSRGVGLFLGLVVGAVGAMAMDSVLGVVMLVSGGLGGYLLGGAFVSELCSEPSCRATLARGAVACPACGGTIEGTIQTASEHYSAAASFRRSLEEARPRRKKKRKKKRDADASTVA